jgi:hypothetical protein
LGLKEEWGTIAPNGLRAQGGIGALVVLAVLVVLVVVLVAVVVWHNFMEDCKVESKVEFTIVAHGGWWCWW